MSVLIPFDSSTNLDVYKKLVKSYFNDSDAEALVTWKEIFKAKTTEDWYERGMYLTGLNRPSEIDESEEIPIQDPTFGGTKDWKQKTWASGFRYSDRFRRFEKQNILEMLSRDLGKNMKEGKDIEVHRLLTTPCATTYAASMTDSKSLINDSHDNLDGSTYDNKGTSELGVTALHTARLYFRKLPDLNGQVRPKTPTHLIVPPDLEQTALEITGTAKMPYTPNNTDNIIPSWKLRVVVDPRLTDTDDWFLAAPNDSDYGLFVLTAMEPDQQAMAAPNNSRDMIATSMQYFTYGIEDPRGIYGGIN